MKSTNEDIINTLIKELKTGDNLYTKLICGKTPRRMSTTIKILPEIKILQDDLKNGRN